MLCLFLVSLYYAYLTLGALLQDWPTDAGLRGLAPRSSYHHTLFHTYIHIYIVLAPRPSYHTPFFLSYPVLLIIIVYKYEHGGLYFVSDHGKRRNA